MQMSRTRPVTQGWTSEARVFLYCYKLIIILFQLYPYIFVLIYLFVYFTMFSLSVQLSSHEIARQ